MMHVDDEAVGRLLSLQQPDESDAAFAERMGIAPQVLSNYKNEHHSLSLASALRINEHAGISLDWLLTGEGAPRSDGDEVDEHFDDGGRFVLRRLLRSVLEVMVSSRDAGFIADEDAEAIRVPIESYLEGSPKN